MFEKILEVARTTMRNYLGLKMNEDVFIVCDQERLRIADALALVADELGARATILVVTDRFRKTRTIREPLVSEHMKEMLKNMDVIIVCLANIASEVNFRRIFVRTIRHAPVRVANLPGITEDTFIEALKAPELEEIERLGNEIARLLANGKKTRVTSPGGTDISFDLYGWKIPPEISTGYLLESSIWGNLPGAEVYAPPVAGSAEGRIVIDVTIDPDHRMMGPVSFDVHKGRVDRGSVRSKDKKAIELLRETLEIKNGDAICEFGLGLNKEIEKVTGTTLIDEKRYKTAHFALGDNIEFGGSISSTIHYDMVFDKPSVWIDETLIIKDGIPTYKGVHLKNDYRDFRGTLPMSTFVKATPWATCMRSNGYLTQLWRGGANRMHVYQLGERRTSYLAEKIWSAINHGGSDIATIVSRTKLDSKIVKKVIEFLIFHGILEQSKGSLINKTEALEKMAKKKEDYDKIEILRDTKVGCI